MEANPRYCNISEDNNVITISHFKPSEDGEGFDAIPIPDLTLPANAPAEKIGKVIMEALKCSE